MSTPRRMHDILFSITTGVVAGVIAWRLTSFLDIKRYYEAPYWLLVLILPFLWIAIVKIAYLAGRRVSFLSQFGKFTVIGFTNAMIDFGFLNLLISYTGIEHGMAFSLFKAVSFTLANISSYMLNKYWAFESISERAHAKEYGAFLTVSLTGLAFNVGAASFVVNGIGPLFGVDTLVWATVGAIAGSAAALIVNFIGYKLVVFRK